MRSAAAEVIFFSKLYPILDPKSRIRDRKPQKCNDVIPRRDIQSSEVSNSLSRYLEHGGRVRLTSDVSKRQAGQHGQPDCF